MGLELADDPVGVPIAHLRAPAPDVVNFAGHVTPYFTRDFL
jgi:hypothetical protein